MQRFSLEVTNKLKENVNMFPSFQIFLIDPVNGNREKKSQTLILLSLKLLYAVASKRASQNRLVGLRILIESQHRESNVVTKTTLLTVGGRKKSLPEGGFLKSCFLCRRELSLDKDVYMYRGDQGFCSVECRCQQILLDERREFEASKREWQRMQNRRHGLPKIRESDHRRRVALGA
ncbi:uncharacterized protein LOC109845663 [Asparagus officinalis]|uniref:uncharacterized protein LOC109845663 n=1 Tax=Asparagus officinalis TaxID=4686 RepID=UPI00098E3B4F|nr:uncharacterized protein LOC109845663 [Asparagus officinalis]